MKYINGKYYGISTEIDDISDVEDLAIFNCLDTGMQYRFFEGKWYKQPVYWVDRDDVDSGGGSGGSSDLPDVTVADNGDVLTVVNGAWDKAEPSGGSSDIVYCHFYDGVDPLTFDDVYLCDKTAEELVAAVTAGKQILAINSEPGDSTVFQSTAVVTLQVNYVPDTTDISSFIAMFDSVWAVPGGAELAHSVYSYYIEDAPTISKSTDLFSLSPSDEDQ